MTPHICGMLGEIILKGEIMKQIKIDQTINLTIDGKEFSLTKEEAKNLYYALQNSLEKSDVVHPPYQSIGYLRWFNNRT